MNLKKTVTLLLAITMLLSTLTACGTKTSDATSSGASSTTEQKAEQQGEAPAESKTNADGSPIYPLVEPGTATLKIATRDNWYAPKSFNDNLPVYQELEKLTGVQIEWEALPYTEYDAVIQTRIASGTDLPDIFNSPWSANLDKIGLDGIAIDQKDLIAENAFWLNRMMEMQPHVRSSITSADGAIYWYPGFGEGLISGYKDMETGVREDPLANINLHVPGVRKDWLDKLGLDVPETLDDWHTVLTAFKNDDPTGEGKTIIPLIADWEYRNLLSFGSAFGIYLTGNADDNSVAGGWDLDGSKVVYKYTDTRLRDTLAVLAQWYKEGLIDPEFARENQYEYNTEKINKNIVGACSSEWMSNFPSFNQNLQAAGVDANYIPVKPVKDPSGNSVTYNRWPIWKDMAISKDCKDPALAIKWIDAHCLSPEGIKLQMFGVLGESYTDEGGKLKYTDFVLNNSEGLGPFEAVRSLGGWAQIAYIQTKEAYVGLYETNPQMLEFSGSFKAEQVSIPFPSTNCLPFTLEEASEFAEIMSNVRIYRDESIIKFIEGGLPIDSWDTYVQGLEGMGLVRAMEIVQSAYDRYAASSK